MRKILLITLFLFTISIADMNEASIKLQEYQAKKTIISEIQRKADELINSLVEVINEKDIEIKKLKEQIKWKNYY